MDTIFGSERQGLSTKEQMRQLATLLVTTLELVCQLFTTAESGTATEPPVSPVESRLLLSSKLGISDLVSLAESPSFRYIPQAIREYRIGTKLEKEGHKLEDVHRECQKFVSELEERSRPQVASRLADLNSLTAVMQVCSAAREILPKESSGPSISDACSVALGDKLSAWDRFFRAEFLERIREIISKQLEGAMDGCLEALRCVKTKAVQNGRSPLEQSVDLFTWSESPSDLLSSGSLKGNNLAMKTRGLTPQVQAICGLLDRQLESLLGELEAFPAKDRSQQAWVAVEGHLSSAAVAQLTRWLSFLEQETASSSREPDW